MTAPTPQQVQAAQGTRLSNKNPWDTYSDDMSLKMTPEMEKAVAEYAQNVHDDSSNQNKEELARWKEANDETAKEYKWCTEEEYADIQMRFGRIMHSSELITRLRKRNVKCWYRDHPHADKLTLLIDMTNGQCPPEVGCWAQRGFMPEYTVMGFDDHGVPLAEKYRGWRTVLLQLILKGAITEEVAHKEFGEPLRPCAERYKTILYHWRNRDRSATEVN